VKRLKHEDMVEAWEECSKRYPVTLAVYNIVYRYDDKDPESVWCHEMNLRYRGSDD